MLPCYDEGEHFTPSCQQIFTVLKKLRQPFEVIFVEDSSRDNTKTLITAYIRRHPSERIKTILHLANEGRGKTVTDGIHTAVGTYVGYIDIDCEVSPDYITPFLEKVEEGYDVVCGWRVYKTSFNGVLRALASKIYSLLVRLLLKVKTPDTEAGFKFFNRQKILPILKQTKDSGWFWDTEIMVRAERAGLRIASVPVVFERRHDKTSTVNLWKDTYDYLTKLWQFRKILQRASN